MGSHFNTPQLDLLAFKQCQITYKNMRNGQLQDNDITVQTLFSFAFCGVSNRPRLPGDDADS